jgi:HAD superfamily hydrolase (TIGR01509 family)
MTARKNLLQLFYESAGDPSMPTPRFVVLDWDNTLHDSAGTNYAALERVLNDYGLHVSPESYRRAYTVDYRRLYLDLGLAEGQIEEASGRWRQLVSEARPRLLPGAATALDALLRDGARLALVTSAPRSVVEPQLQELALGDRFAVTVFGDGQPPRPHPEPLLQALAGLGARPRDAAFCSDTSADMRMGRATGVHPVGISSFAFGPAMLCAAGAELTAPSVAAWVEGRATACGG